MLNFFLNQNISISSGITISADQTSLSYLFGASSKYTTLTVVPDDTPIFSVSRSWISYSYNSTNKILTISVTENTNEFNRLGHVDVSHPSDSSVRVRINIDQAGVELL
jgi:hypothetical protein